MLANPYVRALLVNLVLFVAAAVRLFQQMGTKWTARHTAAAYVLGIVFVISTSIVGTLSWRSAQRWSWLRVVMISIACSLGTMVLILAAQKVLQGRILSAPPVLARSAVCPPPFPRKIRSDTEPRLWRSQPQRLLLIEACERADRTPPPKFV